MTKRPTPQDLEEQANLLLYGHRKVTEAADLPESFSILGGGAPKRDLIAYAEPKKHPSYPNGHCTECGRKKYSETSHGVCRACYRGRALAAFHDRATAIEYWMDRMDTGVVSNDDRGDTFHKESIHQNDPLRILMEREEFDDA